MVCEVAEVVLLSAAKGIGVAIRRQWMVLFGGPYRPTEGVACISFDPGDLFDDSLDLP